MKRLQRLRAHLKNLVISAFLLLFAACGNDSPSPQHVKQLLNAYFEERVRSYEESVGSAASSLNTGLNDPELTEIMSSFAQSLNPGTPLCEDLVILRQNQIAEKYWNLTVHCEAWRWKDDSKFPLPPPSNLDIKMLRQDGDWKVLSVDQP